MTAPESAATRVGITCVSRTKSAFITCAVQRIQVFWGRRTDDRIGNASTQGQGQAAAGLIVHGVET